VKEEVALTLAKAREKLTTAKLDFEGGQFADAVSRAYYCVFHAISACLLEQGLSYSSHGQLIGAFNREILKPGLLPKDFAKDIQMLFDDRQSADYDIFSPIDVGLAQTEIMMAEKILTSIEGLLLNGPGV
jgi:uncharacterized protein (UPF0332 family)